MKNMELTSLISSASSAVLFHNGFVGETLTFATLAIQDSVKVTMCQNIQRINYQNVLDLKNASSKLNIHRTERSLLLVAQCVEMQMKI